VAQQAQEFHAAALHYQLPEAPPPEDRRADVDLSVRLDLQTAMERESAAEEALSAAMNRLLHK